MRPGDVQARVAFGESIALYRTESGEPRAVFATCPHLGAHLGRGFVRGEQLHCPFHHFGFDGGGRCVSTPYDGPPPKSARLGCLPVRERNGVVLAWWDEADAPPSWEVPEYDAEGWGRLRLSTFRFRGHPQDTTENSVDLGHFTTVHGFDAVDPTAPLEFDGPELMARYRFRHRFGPISAPVDFTAHVHGLGYSMVEVKMPALRVDIRLFVLPLPIENGEIELRLGASGYAPGRLGRLPRALIGSLALATLRHDAGQDIPIWRERVYLDRPALAKGDGPIGPYRRWARQFYPERAARSAEVA